MRPPKPPSEDWSRTYDSGSESGSDSCSTSRSSDSDEERPGPASRGNTRGCGRCCGKRAPAAPPSDAAPEKGGTGKNALARTLRKVAAVHDDEVPTALWAKPSRALALERAEAHQPRFKARVAQPCLRSRAACRRSARAALNADAPCTGHRRQVVCVRRDANYGAADWTRARFWLWCVRRTRRRRLAKACLCLQNPLPRFRAFGESLPMARDAASARALSLSLPGAWFVQLEFMQLLFALLTLFAVPSMYFLAWVCALTLARPLRPLLNRKHPCRPLHATTRRRTTCWVGGCFAGLQLQLLTRFPSLTSRAERFRVSPAPASP